MRNSKMRWFLLLVLVLLVPLLLLTSAVDARIQGPSGDFSSHRIVRPRVYHGRSKREIASTRESDLDHVDVLSVGLELNGELRVLDLRLNLDLVPDNYVERHQHQKGSFKTHKPTKVELCHYQGSIRDVPGSWAAVSTCRGLRGVIFDGEELHHIHPEDEDLQSSHYLYKHSDLITNHTCGYKGTHDHVVEEFKSLENDKKYSRHKRAAATESPIRGPYNANRQSRYVELVLVIDKNEYTALGENLGRVHQHCKDIANIINALYTPLNIFIALVGVEVWTDADEIHLLSDGDQTLNNFLAYRRERLVKSIPNDNAQLLTKMQFNEGVVGKALKGPICTYEFSGGVSVDHSNVVGIVAATVAHEMGHNFGMEHDTMECVCPEDRCIMAPSSGSSGPTHWSSCSLEYLALAFEHGMDYCLRNKPKRLFDSPICGNGFVEPGEQCDCGLVDKCDNPCCNASTCMLHANASCATGECCDLKRCKPKTAGTECRSAEQECDLPEYCTGQSEYCPSDIFKIDGETCNMGKAYCYQGSCRTHNDQCKLLWGPTGLSSDPPCYEMNNKGTKNGNCGFNRTGNNYVKCHDENIFCGMLHCKHLNERLEFGMESVATLSHSFINSAGKIIACRTALVDLGLNQVDPGLAPDGAKCAPGKMCVNQKCMPVAELRMFPGGKACPNNCSGNGVCNSLGHCHCNHGFQPPDCTEPGVGGSLDSGPAEDPNARSEFMMGLYIVFLGIVPTTALISFAIWYARNNGGGVNQWTKKATSSNPISTLSRGFGYHHGHRPSPHTRPSNGIKTIERPGPLSNGLDTIDSSITHQDPACASLLPKSDTDERFNNNFFGQFKGFSISPMNQETSTHQDVKVNGGVMRPAPAPPVWKLDCSSVMATTVPIKTNIKPIQRSSTLIRQSTIPPQEPDNDSVKDVVTKSPAPPALPPPNIGSTARPLISSPILSTTTCTSLELIGSKMPTRPAPEIPTRAQQEKPKIVTSHLENNNESVADKRRAYLEKANVSNSSTLTRIASMLSPISGIVKSNSQNTSYNTHSLPRRHHKVMDKEFLRNLEISNPIPQKEIEIPSTAISVKADTTSVEDKEKRNVIMRTQSMRDPKVSSRPTNIHSFGSMRHPRGPKRPTSIPASVRPTSPPPGPPVKKIDPSNSQEIKKIASVSSYHNPSASVKTAIDRKNDDCANLTSDANLSKISEELSPSNDNIYAVIEESLPEKLKTKKAPIAMSEDIEYKIPKNIEAPADSTDSLGLLSEIVSEISNRNVESIYSTRTLDSPDKQTSKLTPDPNNSTYENFKSPGSIYSNSNVSSGYVNPSAINIPPSAKPEEPINSINSKPSRPSYTPNKSLLASKTLVDKKKENKISPPVPKPGITRTKTPPNISKTSVQKTNLSRPQSRQNSDTSLKGSKTDISLTKGSNGKLNSPDIVSSCSTSQTNKSPDVLSRDNKLKSTATTATTNKTSTLPRQKNITMPPKPSSLLTKAASFSDKNKTSPTSAAAKTVTSRSTTPTKSESKSISKVSNKTNVASLQQKFELTDKCNTGTLTKKKPSDNMTNNK